MAPAMDSAERTPASDPGASGEETTDVRWTDARVRWPEDDETNKTGAAAEESDDEEEEYANPFDPFADPDPTEVFSFRFVTPPETTEQANNNDNNHDDDGDDDDGNDSSSRTMIRLDIHGYKTGSDQVWESTGLTLWKASKYLCDYMVQHADGLRNQRVLELGAGLGLNGILAHRLGAESVVVTDGDSDAMVELRKNISVNRERRTGDGGSEPSDRRVLSAAQLIWGKDSSGAFLEREIAARSVEAEATATAAGGGASSFSRILASDVVYAPMVIDPLFETVRTLLRNPGGEFWLAFAVRKVPVTVGFVLERARCHGFRYELVDEQQEGADDDDDADADTNDESNSGGGGYGVEDDPETGPVFVYVFRWDTDADETGETGA